MKSKLSAAVVAATCALAAPAHADIVGDTIHAYRLFPDAGTALVDLGTFTVPGGGCSECAQNSGIAYNVTGTQITITLRGLSSFFIAASFNGFEFVDVSKNAGIVGIILDSATTAAGVSGADATFTSNSIFHNFQGETWGMRLNLVDQFFHSMAGLL
jgi:hypothetical protein